jgi:hypothetical protein
MDSLSFNPCKCIDCETKLCDWCMWERLEYMKNLGMLRQSDRKEREDDY